jgi:hypothetical protein
LRSFLASNIPACLQQRKRASRAEITEGRTPFDAGGLEIPDFRYDRPYFGFADHVK